MGDRYVVQNQIESERAICEVLPHKPRDLCRTVQLFASRQMQEKGDHFTLRDELAGIELRHYAFQDLIYYRRQHALVEILAKLAVDRWKRLWGWPRQNAACDINHLKV